jgi:hypothetical protein
LESTVIAGKVALAGLRTRQETLEKEILGHVIGGAHAVNRIGAEVLDAHRTEIGADLEVLGLDFRRLHDATVHLGLDDGRFGPGVVHDNLLRVLVAPMEPTAARQQRGR